MVAHSRQICTHCVMDTSDSRIRFDERGVCDHCNTFYSTILPNWHTDERGALSSGRSPSRSRLRDEAKTSIASSA